MSSLQISLLRDLNVIFGKLEHGTEPRYRERIGVYESAIKKWVSPKEQPGVFLPIEPSTGPDYRSGAIVEELRAHSWDLRSDDDPLS